MMYDKIKRFAYAASLLTLFVGYMLCAFSFFHVHIEDGVKIVHSHPYSSETEHTHTHSELIMIALTSSAYQAIEVPLHFSFNFESYQTYAVKLTRSLQPIPEIHFTAPPSLRAPPVI